jgi:hypothetical protein
MSDMRMRNDGRIRDCQHNKYCRCPSVYKFTDRIDSRLKLPTEKAELRLTILSPHINCARYSVTKNYQHPLTEPTNLTTQIIVGVSDRKIAPGDRTHKEIDRRLTESFYIKRPPLECGLISSARNVPECLLFRERNVMESVMELWKLPAPVLEETASIEVTNPVPSDTEISEEQARDVVERSFLLVAEQGFCLWKCQQLAGAVICIVEDATLPAPSLFEDPGKEKRLAMIMYPVYTFDELNMLGQVGIWTDRIVLEAKRLTGAEVTKVDKEKEAT